MCFYELISAVLTAQNIPLMTPRMTLFDWSKTTLNNVLFILQGDRMYLQALDNI
jgi:hypothetical protein